MENALGTYPNAKIGNKKSEWTKSFASHFEEVGGVDGTRTRDPRRDRPIF